MPRRALEDSEHVQTCSGMSSRGFEGIFARVKTPPNNAYLIIGGVFSAHFWTHYRGGIEF